MSESRFTRRDFVGRAIFIGSSIILAPLAFWKGFENGRGTLVLNSTSATGFFNDAQRRVLAEFSELIFPGAVSLGAVEYIEHLMTAFDSNPPRIYAAGPFSGRQPFAHGGKVSARRPENSFVHFMPLTRYQEAAWKYKLYGSKGLDGGGPNDGVTGPKKGLRESLRYGLDQAIAISKVPIPKLTRGAAKDMFQNGPDKEFRDSLTGLVLEGCFAAPEYGGNKGLRGWQLVQYEGDSQPLGYSIYDEATGVYHERPEHPLSTANPVPDDKEHQLSKRVRLLLFAIVQARKVHIGN